MNSKYRYQNPSGAMQERGKNNNVRAHGATKASRGDKHPKLVFFTHEACSSVSRAPSPARSGPFHQDRNPRTRLYRSSNFGESREDEARSRRQSHTSTSSASPVARSSSLRLSCWRNLCSRVNSICNGTPSTREVTNHG